MKYVVYHISSTMIEKTYDTEGGAKRGIAAKNRRPFACDKYAYASVEDYKNKVVKMVTKRNLLSGEEYQEASNTPSYCSPSSEAYWSM